MWIDEKEMFDVDHYLFVVANRTADDAQSETVTLHLAEAKIQQYGIKHYFP